MRQSQPWFDEERVTSGLVSDGKKGNLGSGTRTGMSGSLADENGLRRGRDRRIPKHNRCDASDNGWMAVVAAVAGAFRIQYSQSLGSNRDQSHLPNHQAEHLREGQYGDVPTARRYLYGALGLRYGYVSARH